MRKQELIKLMVENFGLCFEGKLENGDLYFVNGVYYFAESFKTWREAEKWAKERLALKPMTVS